MKSVPFLLFAAALLASCSPGKLIKRILDSFDNITASMQTSASSYYSRFCKRSFKTLKQLQ